MLKVISRSTFDLQTVLDTLADSAVRLCEADQSVIRRRVDDTYLVAATCGFSSQQREHLERYSTKPDRSSTFGRAIVEGRTVHIPDVIADPEWQRPEQPRATGIRAAVSLPLLGQGVILGVLTVIRTEPRAFSHKQIELLETFADQAVIAIENVRLFDEVQARTEELSESLQQQTATADVLKVISRSAFDLQTVFDTLVELAVRLCEARFGAVFRLDRDLLHFAAQYNFPETHLALLQDEYPVTPNRGTISGRAVLTGAPVQIPDMLADQEYRGRASKEANFRSLLAVPLLRDGRAIGAIVIYRIEPGTFADKQLALLQTFADQAVIAIENVRLFDEVQARTEELSEALAQQTAMSEVLRVISSSPTDLAPVFDTILTHATRLCEGNFAALWQYDGEALVGAAQHNVSPGFAELCRSTKLRPGSEGAVRKSALERRTVQVADITVESGFSPVVLQYENARTVLAVPLLREKHLVGVIGIWRREVQPFTEQQIALVRTFADQAAIAIENARLLNELRELLQQQTATADVLRIISRSTFDLQSVLQTLVELAARLCEADKATITNCANGKTGRKSRSWS